MLVVFCILIKNFMGDEYDFVIMNANYFYFRMFLICSFVLFNVLEEHLEDTSIYFISNYLLSRLCIVSQSVFFREFSIHNLQNEKLEQKV